ncbi:MAG: tripartite tricarboxylate transporter substrate binding protein [Betaproteobacteria bacterium]|nr:tripartite tricarboxylate transporter substrate binding protein [Betaproteobacteria bacterium]
MRMTTASIRWRALLLASALAAAATMGAMPGTASGQSYPSRPIRFIVPFVPGGALDTLARLLAERLQPALGQPVVVENRAGAAARIGTEYVAGRPPDGYTILMTSATLAIVNALSKSLPFDLVKDFQPISLIAVTPFVLAVLPAHPARTAGEFVALARAKPGSITYGTAGVGAVDHIAGAMFASMAGIELVSVPYKGMGEVVQAVLGGQVSASFGSITPLIPQIRSGKLRALGVVSSVRSSILPDVPTLAEAVPLPGYDLYAWLGVTAPAGMPRPIVDRLNAELVRITRDPQFGAEKLLPLGFEPVGSTPEQMLEAIKTDIEKYRKVVRDTKMSAE